MNSTTNPDALQGFTDAVAKRLTGTAGAIGSPCSDRELAAAAWPNAEPWGDLSPQECEEAIRRQLNSAPNSTDTGQ
ncbi:hypothetical protein GGQ07_003432 [Salinibacter ruber]|jgi:hypothetical protein|nr:hypothetical protein [Salinibacter ruber]MCS4181968.1 hypothetical protein [Salinibacter ruber]